MIRLVLAFLIGAGAVFAGGWYWYHRATSIAAGDVIDGIQPLNRLVVFRAYITTTTTARGNGWVCKTYQMMATPSYVNYYVDMGKVTAASVKTSGNHVSITLPKLMVERANVDTAHVQIATEGLCSVLASEVETLRAANTARAIRELWERANMPFLLQAARRAEFDAVSANVRTALASAGHRDLVIELR